MLPNTASREVGMGVYCNVSNVASSVELPPAGRSRRVGNFYRSTGALGFRDFRGFPRFPTPTFSSELQCAAGYPEVTARSVRPTPRLESAVRYPAVTAQWIPSPNTWKAQYVSEYHRNFSPVQPDERNWPAGKSQGGGDVRMMLAEATKLGSLVCCVFLLLTVIYLSIRRN